MTDNEIVKALECCLTEGCADCKNCPYDDFCRAYDNKMLKDALDLIKLQQAKIEGQQADIERQEKKLLSNLITETREVFASNETAITVNWEHAFIKAIKSEARKEFAERVHGIISPEYDEYHKAIDNLLAELDGKENV